MSGPKRGATLRELELRLCAASEREDARLAQLARAAIDFAAANSERYEAKLAELVRAAKAHTNAAHERSRRNKHFETANAERLANQREAFENRPRCTDGGPHLFAHAEDDGKDRGYFCVSCGLRRVPQ